jgi:hypothetical protein
MGRRRSRRLISVVVGCMRGIDVRSIELKAWCCRGVKIRRLPCAWRGGKWRDG